MRDAPLVGRVGADITPHGLRSILDEPGPVRLWLSSEGGDFAAGIACFHVIRARPGVEVHVLRAASAAVLLVVAVDRRTISADGRMLIHRGCGLAAGTAAELAAKAEALARLDADYLGIIAERTGAEIEAALDAAGGEWWITPAEAVSLGLVHEITTGTPDGWTAPEIDADRHAIERQESMLRARLATLADDDRRHAHVQSREAAAEVHATYAADAAATAADFAEAVDALGHETLLGNVEELLRRQVDCTRAALAATRRQLRVLDMGGIPTASTAIAWTCRKCGGANFHEPGKAQSLAPCFHCDQERNDKWT